MGFITLRQSKLSIGVRNHVSHVRLTTLGAETHIQKSILNPKEPQPRFFARHSHPRLSFALDDKVSTSPRTSLDSFHPPLRPRESVFLQDSQTDSDTRTQFDLKFPSKLFRQLRNTSQSCLTRASGTRDLAPSARDLDPGTFFPFAARRFEEFLHTLQFQSL